MPERREFLPLFQAGFRGGGGKGLPSGRSGIFKKIS